MPDITSVWDPILGRGDWVFGSGGLLTGGDLETAIQISLFSDAPATEDWQPPPGSNNDRRGWFANAYLLAAGERVLGSNLWQLERAKKSDSAQVLLKARNYCQIALQWLIDDGVAASINALTFWYAPTVLGIVITVNKPIGAPERFRFDWSWQGV